jgi:hypothetical protein
MGQLATQTWQDGSGATGWQPVVEQTRGDGRDPRTRLGDRFGQASYGADVIVSPWDRERVNR